MDQPLAILPLFKPANQTEQIDSIKTISKKVEKELNKILSTMVTLGDSPFIRYFDPSGASDGISAKLAQQVKIDMDELIATENSFPPPNDFRKTILIIVDRSIDMMAPFIHEFTYQAMMNDILSADKGCQRYTLDDFSPVGDTNSGTASVSFANLDENDPIWV